MNRSNFLKLLVANGFIAVPAASSLGTTKNVASSLSGENAHGADWMSGRTLPPMENEPAWLAKWRARPFIPLSTSDDRETQAWIDACRQGVLVSGCYHGGEFPGRSRRLLPLEVHARVHPLVWAEMRTELPDQPSLDELSQFFDELAEASPHYLRAWCERRGQVRTFALERMGAPRRVGANMAKL